ncbi:hypothetical protein LTS18_001457 [Coniosporium uncinatum]|uniref:Uncharacterized protein n=1 Tax=Coniosporium uncinatum TaxID=93489 RepID=A0ACC3DZ41_9PEZI|nr:hypothetical protein LTS18_001457 [Coniosporium uncinatum]
MSTDNTKTYTAEEDPTGSKAAAQAPGYMKHPCYFRYTHNCPNWVWGWGQACNPCMAQGRFSPDENHGAAKK